MAFLIGLVLAGCSGSKSGGGDTTPRVASVTVTLPSASIAVGATETATALARDQNGAVMSGVVFSWASSDPGVATVSGGVATGVTAGTAGITAASGGVTSGAAVLTVTQAAGQDFLVRPASVKLTVDGRAMLLAVAPPGALTWTSSDPGVVTVDSSGQITAVARGSAVVTATSGTATATSSVKVFRTSGASPDPTSEALIAQALALGTISAELALEYRVFALFGDPRLPAQYDGAPNAGPDHMLLREVLAQLPALSQPAQDVLGPFFLPPIYAESAHTSRLGAYLAPVAPPGSPPQASSPRRLASGINCSVAAGPSAYRRVSVTTTDNRFTFNVFYFPSGGGPDVEQQALAEIIASVALEAYDAETGLFDRFPLPDGGLPCNGGDAGIDIYLVPMGDLKLAGQTIQYNGQCANTPSFIQLNLYHPIFFVGMVQPTANARSAQKGVVAHEFLHLLQLAMNRSASCADTKWFDEATAEWAMDFVEPKFAPSAILAPGFEDGIETVSTRKRRSGQFYAEYLYSGHRRSLEKGVERYFGYADYLFFQYLARTQTPQAIRMIYDAMAGGKDSLGSIDAAIDMTAVWPEFAKTLWNDVTGNVLDYWRTEDGYDFGLADVYSNPGVLDGAPSDLKPLEIDQLGKSEQIFTLLDNALERSASGDYEIPPRSMIYEQLKFTDPTVHTAIFTNPVAGDPGAQHMKVWAVKKVGGAWKPPEDWTQEPIKAFCLDKKDERLEELLVIVSNSEISPATETPYRIPLQAPMQLATTNVGCWQWQGTASLTTQTVDGPVTVQSATVTFDQARSVAAGLPDAGMSLSYLVLGTFTASTASYSISGLDPVSGCTFTGSATAAMQTRSSGGIVDTDGDLIIGFGLPDPVHRAVIGNGTTLIPGVAVAIACPLASDVAIIDENVQWLSLPDPSPTVSADGQSFSGTWARTDADGDKVSVWNLHALREP